MSPNLTPVAYDDYFEPFPGSSDTDTAGRGAEPEPQTSHTHSSVLEPVDDSIVCGSGSSGSAVAGRVAENPDVSVLLVKAGGADDVPSVIEANQRPP